MPICSFPLVVNRVHDYAKGGGAGARAFRPQAAKMRLKRDVRESLDKMTGILHITVQTGGPQ